MSIKRLSGAGLTTPKSNKLWDQTTFQSGMFALATVSLTSTASSIVFSGIPANYTHLQLRMNSINASAQSVIMQFNSDTSSNYAKHALFGNGSSASAGGYATQSYINIQGYSIAGGTPNPVVGVVDILDYANTSKLKTVRILSGFDANGSGEVSLNSGLWFKAGSGVTSDAVTTITLKLESGGNFAAYSHFALYGIKVA
jgi:hypothetical protein